MNEGREALEANQAETVAMNGGDKRGRENRRRIG